MLIWERCVYSQQAGAVYAIIALAQFPVVIWVSALQVALGEDFSDIAQGFRSTLFSVPLARFSTVQLIGVQFALSNRITLARSRVDPNY